MALTSRQQEILDFIRRSLAGRGIPPTRAEIVEAFGFRSPTAAEDHLRALARKGVIELLGGGASRGIRLASSLVEAASGHSLPLVGNVAAGQPLLAAECIETHCQIDPALFHPRADFLLRVRGESMRDAGIRHADLLAVHKQASARNGEIVIARMGDEVTVKRFQREGATVRLLPANPDFASIRIDLSRQELFIEGLAVGVIRAGLTMA
jgi:repressor LexA